MINEESNSYLCYLRLSSFTTVIWRMESYESHKSLNKNNFTLFFTVRKRSCGKVMFLHLSVILSMGGVCPSTCWDTPPQADTPWHTPPRQTPLPGQTPPLADGYCYGRYAFYWNAFLLFMKFTLHL